MTAFDFKAETARVRAEYPEEAKNITFIDSASPFARLKIWLWIHRNSAGCKKAEYELARKDLRAKSLLKPLLAPYWRAAGLHLKREHFTEKDLETGRGLLCVKTRQQTKWPFNNLHFVFNHELGHHLMPKGLMSRPDGLDAAGLMHMDSICETQAELFGAARSLRDKTVSVREIAKIAALRARDCIRRKDGDYMTYPGLRALLRGHRKFSALSPAGVKAAAIEYAEKHGVTETKMREMVDSGVYARKPDFNFDKLVEEARRDYPEETANVTFIDARDKNAWDKTLEWMRGEKSSDNPFSFMQAWCKTLQHFATLPAGRVTTDPKNPQRLLLSLNSRKFETFYHELGHALMPAARRKATHEPGDSWWKLREKGRRCEALADTFSFMLGMQKDTLDKSHIERKAKHRARRAFSTIEYLTMQELDSLAIDAKTAGFVSLSPAQILTLAQEHAARFLQTPSAMSSIGHEINLFWDKLPRDLAKHVKDSPWKKIRRAFDKCRGEKSFRPRYMPSFAKTPAAVRRHIVATFTAAAGKHDENSFQHYVFSSIAKAYAR